MSGHLTTEHVNRRIRSAVAREVASSPEPAASGNEAGGNATNFALMAASSPAELPIAAGGGAGQPAEQLGLSQRINTFVVERLLQGLNLTSYKNLVRSQARLAHTREEAAVLAEEVVRLRSTTDQFSQQVAELLPQRASLTADLAAVIAQRDAAIGVEQSFRDQREVLADQRNRLISLVATISAERTRLVRQAELAKAAADAQQETIEQLRSILAPLFSSVTQLRVEVAESKRLEQLSIDPAANPHLRIFESVRRDLLRGDTRTKVRALLEELYGQDGDPNLAGLWEQYEASQMHSLAYWDVRTAVRVLAHHLQPRTYLEVGTRRGWSLAQVFAECPDAKAYVFDLWEAEYGGTQQGSPQFVSAKMQSVVGEQHIPWLQFVTGNSHDTLPVFLSAIDQTDMEQGIPKFDLVTVDGDHSRLGAWWDLCDLFPHVALGGALVFDDLEYAGDEESGRPLPTSEYPRRPLPPMLESLADVWAQMQISHQNFVFLSTPVLKYRAGIAFRVA